MRKEVILGVADAIENKLVPTMKFNMSSWCGSEYDLDPATEKYHVCGTAACIAGWTVALYDEDGNRRPKPLTATELLEVTELPPDDDHPDVSTFFSRGAKAMGLGEKAAELFIPDFIEFVDDKIAVATLRKLAETGDVEWPKDELQQKYDEYYGDGE